VVRLSPYLLAQTHRRQLKKESMYNQTTEHEPPQFDPVLEWVEVQRPSQLHPERVRKNSKNNESFFNNIFFPFLSFPFLSCLLSFFVTAFESNLTGFFSLFNFSSARHSIAYHELRRMDKIKHIRRINEKRNLLVSGSYCPATGETLLELAQEVVRLRASERRDFLSVDEVAHEELDHHLEGLQARMKSRVLGS